jgi:hypothetical protein
VHLALLTTVLPRGKRLGGDIGSQVFIDALLKRYPDLRVFGYDRPSGNAPPVPWETVVERRPIETSDTPRLRSASWMLAAVARRRPYSVQKYISRRYREVAQALRSEVDLFVIDHAQVGWLVPHLGGRPFIYIAHNVESEVYRTQAQAAGGLAGRWRYGREARIIEAFERSLVAEAEVVFTVTQRDADFFEGSVPGARAVSFAQPPSAIPAPEPRRTPEFDVGLLGTWAWAANAVGLRWFVEEVAPLLPDGLDIRAAGVGAEEIVAGTTSVQAVGRVPDAVDFLRSARIVLIPTRAGGGVQIKSIDAISTGARIVATPLAVRGIGELPAHVAVAEGPEDFAAAVAAMLAEPPSGTEMEDSYRWATSRAERFAKAVGDEAAAVCAALAPPAVSAAG